MKTAKQLEGQNGRDLQTSLLTISVEILPLMRLLQNICALTILKMEIPEAK